MLQVIAIAAGGAVGSLLRFWASNGVYALFGRGFPYGTLTVNVVGSLAMGFLWAVLFDRTTMGPEARNAVLVGLLGGFTTFSSFSIETINLMEQADYLKAGLNVLLSVMICVPAAWLGLLTGRSL